MTKQLSLFAVFTLLVSAAAFPSFMHAQQFAPEKASSSLATDDLPDAPGAMLERESLFQGAGGQGAKPVGAPKPEVASKYKLTIRADQTAQPLSTKDKFVLSLRNRASLSATGSILFSTSISYWRNGRPHYGTDLPAFGERFGAAELRQTSQSFFINGLYAAAFHDDPRYYVMGPKEKVKKRAIYAATRVLITRKDDGSTATNWSRLLGIASGVALTNAYYPPVDRSIGRTVSGTFSSIGATAGSNVLREFMGDIRQRVFHKKQDAVQP